MCANLCYGQDVSYQFSQLNIYNGLPNNAVRAILKDKKGFLWFGTSAGLCRFDGVKYKLFKHDEQDSTSLHDDQVLRIFEGPDSKLWIKTKFGLNLYNIETETISRDLETVVRNLHLPDLSFSDVKKDSYGNFWFVYPGKGLYCYNVSTKTTRHIFNSAKSRVLYSNFVSSVHSDSKGFLWIIYQDGFIEKVAGSTNKVVYRADKIKTRYKGINDFVVTVDNDDDPWFYCNEGLNYVGAFFIDSKTLTINHLSEKNDRGKLSSDNVRGVVQDKNGLVWIATDHGGVNLFSKKNLSVKYITNQEGDEKSLAQNSIIGIYIDEDGVIWLGTHKKGISYYHPNINRFPLFKRILSKANALPYNDINKFAEDDKGNIWIGTNGGGLLYLNRKTGKYTQYLHDKNEPNSLSSNVVVSLLLSHDKKLYIGTYLGGMDCFDGNKFIHFNTSTAPIIGDDSIWELIEDSRKRIWIGTIRRGVTIYDPQTKTFKKFKNEEGSIRSQYVPAMFQDRDSNIWFGGYAALDMLNYKTGKFEYFDHDKNDPHSLIHNNVTSIMQDSRGWMWIGTMGGISVLTNKSRKFINIRRNTGLPGEAALDIIEDNDKNMWVTGVNGICMIKVVKTGSKYSIKLNNFDEKDGLQGRVFNENAALKLKSGELIFGGVNGFNLFMPSKLHDYKEKPNLVLTGLQLFNQPVGVNQEVNGGIILKKSISELKEIELNHNQNFFTIEFAALNYFHPEKIKYQYMMKGLDNRWIDVSESHQATYMHLKPGRYTFTVRALNGSISTSKSLHIEILPPFYQTTFAYFLYLGSILAMLFLIRRNGIQKIRTKFALEQERKEAEVQLENLRKEARQTNELYLLKIKFFTNVSHEFRTPLSLILAPIDRLLQTVNSPADKSQISLLKKNADRLLNLVNQLLDFRKMEANEVELNVKRDDIILFIKDVCDSFTDIADAKRIRFVFNSEISSFDTLFDHDKIERIILNLLSNAFKFTHPNGKICVFLDEVKTRSQTKEKVLQIKVIDSGIGIPADKIAAVFDNFFQTKTPESILNQGSGIGLSIVKEFVEMHKGIINVDSKPKEGTCFTLEIPFPVLKVKKEEFLPATVESVITEEHVAAPVENLKAKPTILLVEDNDDFREYLRESLSSYYSIIEAANGKEGWQKALSLHPDLVVSDISMPGMDGIELLKKIKADKRTYHIPFILLTALTGDQELLKGLQTGANEYITKPFSFEVLMSKIKNLLMLQQSFKKVYSKQVNMNLADIPVESENEKFMATMIAYIEKNLHNQQLSVEDLSKHMAMSRVSLYKRVLAISGKTPVDFIRSYRLKKSIQLFEKSQRTIAEIAYEVGFNTPNYFAKAFKNEFGMLPSEYISKYRNNEDFKVSQS